MNPLAPFIWLMDNWRTALFVALLAALGAQTYRLRDAQADRDVLATREKDRLSRDALRDATNIRNKERTDDETANALRRAASSVVRGNSAQGIKLNAAAPAVGGDAEVACFGGGQLDAELAGFAGRTAQRLADLLDRNAGRLGGVAQEGEAVAAIARALRAWALNLEAAADRPDPAWVAQGTGGRPRLAQVWPGATAGRAGPGRPLP